MESTLRRYDVRGKKRGWAIIVIDTSIGYFSAVSDWGNYAYLWDSPGMEFRKFLTTCDEHYFWEKITYGRERYIYDGEATAKAIEEWLTENTDSDLYDEEKYLFDSMRDDIESNKRDFDTWCNRTKLEESWEFRQQAPEPRSWGFVKNLLPLFQQKLREELEAPAA